MIYAGFAFIVTMILLQVVCGIAVFGFTGGKPLIHRNESPGIFWFSIALQVIFGLVLPAIIVLSGGL